MRLLFVSIALASACGPVGAPALEAAASSDAALDVASEAAPESTPEAAPDVAPEAAREPACVDRDGDGYTDRACGGADCDDTDPRAHPGQAPRCVGGYDTDCDGTADAQEPSARSGRCALEALERGLSPQATTICDAPHARCLSCVGTGAAERCVCWSDNSGVGYQSCVR